MIFCVMLSVLEEKILYVEFFFIFSSKSDENVPYAINRYKFKLLIELFSFKIM